MKTHAAGPFCAFFHEPGDFGNAVRASRTWAGFQVLSKTRRALRCERQGHGSKQHRRRTQTTTNDSGYYVVTTSHPVSINDRPRPPVSKKYETTNNKLDPSADLVIDATLSVGAAKPNGRGSASAVPAADGIGSGEKDVTRSRLTRSS